MREKKRLLGAGISRRARSASVRPYTIRVVRDHGDGLWTFESNSGQLFLAVLSKSVDDFRKERERVRAAAGDKFDPPRLGAARDRSA